MKFNLKVTIDEVVDKIVCDSRSHSICMGRFINMIEDCGED